MRTARWQADPVMSLGRRRPFISAFGACQVVLAILAIGGATPARSGEPQAYLSWRAPYGRPRATDTLSAPCDSTEHETLFVSFTTGQSGSHLLAVDAAIEFRAARGDTLGRSWWYGGGADNRWNVWVEFPDSVEGTANPWVAPGPKAPAYDRTAHRGRLSFGFEVPTVAAIAVRDSTPYCFARVIVPRPRQGVERCDQPICIELSDVKLYFMRRFSTAAVLPAHSVTWNSPDRAVCGGPRDEGPTKKGTPPPRKAKRKRAPRRLRGR